nr:MAG: hypothetical protein [Bacteriophage sp.]UWD61963.1 MAG: hypothetical protein [Bacteriophage sp.]UWF85722.1 MAG: hypothetical protein [Bacteriophage sp.]
MEAWKWVIITEIETAVLYVVIMAVVIWWVGRD